MPFLLFESYKNEIMKKIIYLIQNQSIKNIVSATSKMTIMFANIKIVFDS